MEHLSEIYQTEKENLLSLGVSQERPFAILLGGQPASGKSGLTNSLRSNYNFLFSINGDEYRQFLSQAVNFIKIYSYLGQSLITEYKLINGKWTNPELPATAIIYERQRQANDKELLETQIQSGKELLSKHDIEPAIAKNISFVVSDLEKLYKQRNN